MGDRHGAPACFPLLHPKSSTSAQGKKEGRDLRAAGGLWGLSGIAACAVSCGVLLGNFQREVSVVGKAQNCV